MSDAIDLAELDGQQVELLPARTVLSLFSAVGNNGDPGVPGANGQGVAGKSMPLMFLFNYIYSDSSGTYSGSGEGSAPSGTGS